MPYMSVAAIDAAIDHVAVTFPSLARTIALPERSVEGRLIKALWIAGDGAAGNMPDARVGVLLVGGIHARELINPETLIEFALRLCTARTNGTGLSFGPKAYTSNQVQLLVDALSILILPMANPDGRNFCLIAGGNPMWRKNRAQNPGLPCRGVDLNRNTSFLWSSGIGTTTDSCNDVFKGPSAFSEPETRNVRWLIDCFPGISTMVDVHSYSELVLYPWGDDDNQTSDPNQSFQNPAFDGQRGTPGNNYKEYIPPADLAAHQAMGNRIRNGIAAVRGRNYVVQQSIDLYPTSGTWHDYAYSRKFVETGRRRILGFTLETAQEFQPGDPEKVQVISETQAGLMECLFQTMCPAEAVQAMSTSQSFALEAMRSFRDNHLLASVKGRHLEETFRRHAGELVGLLSDRPEVLRAARAALIAAGDLAANEDSLAKPINSAQASDFARVVELVRKHGSKELQVDIERAVATLGDVDGVALVRLFHAPKRPAVTGNRTKAGTGKRLQPTPSVKKPDRAATKAVGKRAPTKTRASKKKFGRR